MHIIRKFPSCVQIQVAVQENYRKNVKIYKRDRTEYIKITG